jgi:hypothetical protein
MNKKLAHLILLFGDLLCFWVFWIGYHGYMNTLTEIKSYADIIRFGNRAGFFIIGLFLPPAHLLMVIENFWPNVIHKYKRFLNQSVVVILIALIGAGIIGSSWIKSKVENAGYVYCREVSGISALFRSLVYTKDMAMCEDLVADKYKKH